MPIGFRGTHYSMPIRDYSLNGYIKRINGRLNVAASTEGDDLPLRNGTRFFGSLFLFLKFFSRSIIKANGLVILSRVSSTVIDCTILRHNARSR